MSIKKGTLDSITTKDKGKATLTAIQYSAPDRAILFSFYNHSPTTLGMGWWDKYQPWKVEPTRGRWIRDTGQYKRKSKQSREGAGKNGQKPEPPRPPPGERLLRRTWFNYVWTPWKTTVLWPRPSLSNPRSINDIVWVFLRTNPTLLRVVTNCDLTVLFIFIFFSFSFCMVIYFQDYGVISLYLFFFLFIFAWYFTLKKSSTGKYFFSRFFFCKFYIIKWIINI